MEHITITPDSTRWPALLCEIPEKDRPAHLYIKGELPPPDTLVVAIVGTRRPTTYGLTITADIAKHLARAGIVVASGMALGIDSQAHKACLNAGGKTIAVLGSGFNERVIYPQTNRSLARRITENGGCLISEYAPEERATKWTFPARNRIIAGIAHAAVIIEAREKSGALITARLATEYNRDVFALPGNILQETARGTNMLIHDGAIPVTSPEDITRALGVKENSKDNTMADTALNAEETAIINTLGEPRTLDEIIKRGNMSGTRTLGAISQLEIRGIIKHIGNGVYRKT